MSCGYSSGADSYTLVGCYLSILNADGMPILAGDVSTFNLCLTSGGNLQINDKIFGEPDAIALGFDDLPAFVSFLSTSAATCSVDANDILVGGVSHFNMCRVADTKEVVIEACKDELGVVVYTDVETSSTGDIVWLQANYSPDCEVNCQCTTIQLEFDGVVDNATVLSALGAETYPDGSVGGSTGIRGIVLGQSGGSGSLVWNGGDAVVYPSGSSKDYTSEGFIDIPPFEYTVVKGKVVVEAIVYKCA